MARSWGQIWTGGDGRSVELDGVVPQGWAFGQSCEGGASSEFITLIDRSLL
jgi:hypothetical protein